MRNEKPRPREDYRQQQSQRAKESVSLSEKFPELKSLTVEFEYFTPEGLSRNRQIKYTVNPRFAKSVFRLDCLNDQCVCGDFDLSAAISEALASRRATATGELRCLGWIDQSAINKLRCNQILRYNLILECGARDSAEITQLQAV